MNETIKLDDLRLFAAVVRAGSFSGAARALAVPKQTVSRRVAELERLLGRQLLQRTTRRVRPTELGQAYAARCAEVVRLAEEATRAVVDQHEVPRGILRVTADPVFGEAWLGPLLFEYARRWPEVALEVLLTRRRVDLVDERFDVAFRVGAGDERGLVAHPLGPARVRYCASPGYLARRGAPDRPEALVVHDCILVASDAAPVRWPFRGEAGPRLLEVRGRLRSSSFALAHAAALAGLGIALLPEFACAADLRRGRLEAVLEPFTVEVGAVRLLHAGDRFPPARVRAFVALARERLGEAPWVSAGSSGRTGRSAPGRRRAPSGGRTARTPGR